MNNLETNFTIIGAAVACLFGGVYYLNKKGVERNAAKMFYQLIVDQKKFRVEIRWKGNIHTSSPQFQIYEDKDDSRSL